MNFKQALEQMKQGKKVKLPSWGGYWTWDEVKQTVLMHCRPGNSDTGNPIMDIRETQRVEYTMMNVCSDEWVIADETNTPILGGAATFNFGEAIKYLKRGFKVARKGWNGKGMFLFLAHNIDLKTEADLSCCEHLEGELVLPSIVMKTADDHFCVGWLASQADMLAEDWVFVD